MNDQTIFAIQEWTASGLGSLHLHEEGDEAWHVLEGTLRFRFPHNKWMPRGLNRLCACGSPSLVRATPRDRHNALMGKFKPEILE